MLYNRPENPDLLGHVIQHGKYRVFLSYNIFWCHIALSYNTFTCSWVTYISFFAYITAKRRITHIKRCDLIGRKCDILGNM